MQRTLIIFFQILELNFMKFFIDFLVFQILLLDNNKTVQILMFQMFKKKNANIRLENIPKITVHNLKF
jgi:hypothetical protein